MVLSKSQNQRIEKRLQDSSNDLTEENKRINDAMIKLRKENEDLLKSLQSGHKLASEKEKENDKLAERLIILQENLKNAESQIEVSYITIKELKENLKKLELYNENKPLAVNQISVNSDDDLRQKLEEFQRESFKLADQLMSLSRQKLETDEKLERTLISRKEMLDSVEELRKSQQIESFRYEKIIQALNSELKLKTAEISEVAEQFKYGENQRKFLVDDLKNLEAQISEKIQQISEMSINYNKIDAENTVLRKNLIDNEKSIDQIKEIAQLYDEASKEIKVLNEENSLLKGKLKKAEKNAEEAIHKREKEKLK